MTRKTFVAVLFSTVIVALLLGGGWAFTPQQATDSPASSTLTAPDHPSLVNHEANSITSLSVADPAASIQLIEPPEADASGDARIELPIELPPGRNGLQPALAIAYSSGGGNGSMGLGWSLPVPSVEVDTTFGVPRYSPTRETETYLLEGSFLAPVANLTDPAPRASDRVFVRRVEGSFERIVRKGDRPGNYWWEVTDKQGTRFIYGRSEVARLHDSAPPQNVFRWFLEQIVDTHGNRVDFSYFTDSGSGTASSSGSSGEPWVQVYLEAIDYTAGKGVEPYYRVELAYDDGDRPDVVSSGRPGFKTLTRLRLETIAVLAGGDPVRSYELSYEAGDFHKSLLESVAVVGPPGAGELARHSFEYHTMPRSGDGFDGFGPAEAWNGMSSSDGATHTTNVSGGAHAFVGLGLPGCNPHVGVQAGGGGGATWTTRSFVDVNGDGLPDRLSDDAEVELNTMGSFENRSFPGASDLARTQDVQLDLGVGAHVAFVSTGASWVWSHGNDDRAISDVNGDGWPDLVSTNGSFQVRLNDGGTRFGDPVPWGGFSYQGIDLSVEEENEEVLDSFDLSNSLLKLKLPFAGTVSVTGAVKKLATGGLDGVEASIFHNGSLVWKRFFAPNDLAECSPGPSNSCSGGLSLDVAAGDRLYFMSDSIEDTTADALAWTPAATYQGKDQAALEVYGAKVFAFDGGEDFRLAGPPGSVWVATATGSALVLGTIEKQETADDVTVVIVRGKDGRRGTEVVYSRSLTASQTGSFGDFPPISVTEKDTLVLEIRADSQVDADRVLWDQPKISFDGGTVCPSGDPAGADCATLTCNRAAAGAATGDRGRLAGRIECSLGGQAVSLPAANIEQPAQVETAVHNLLPADQPTVSWPAPDAGTYEVTVDWSSETPAAEPVLLYVQGVHRLFAKREVPAGQKELQFSVPVELSAGEPLFVTSLAQTASDSGTLTASAGEESLPVNERWYDPDGDRMAGGYHRWFYGEWNGEVAFYEPPPTEDPEDESEDMIAAVPHWQGFGDFPEPIWRAAGFDLHLARGGAKPSRRGGNAVVELSEASGQEGTGPKVVRKTYGRTASASISLGLNAATSSGFSVTQVDLLDMNGDRYPDQVTAGKVRFSNGVDAFGPLEDVSGMTGDLRQGVDGSSSLGLGIGVTFTRKDGKGKTKEVVKTMPSVGETLSISQPRRNLLDVNGDGLPDLVDVKPNGSTAEVRLNLGYRFGNPESWDLPPWKTRTLCTPVPIKLPLSPDLETTDAMGVTSTGSYNLGVAIGPIGGGVTFGLSRDVVELADINGDGLVDHLLRDHGSDAFWVKLNLGDGWSEAVPWYEPSWGDLLDDYFEARGLQTGEVDPLDCFDAVSSNGTLGGNGSVGVPVCIPLVPPIVVAGLQLEVSGQLSGADGGMELLFEDVNGDGLADHALKVGGDPTFYMKPNLASRVNLLKRVDRPLGGSFTIDYRRQGNRVDYSDAAHRIDMPETQWVLASTTLDDGRGNLYSTRYDYFDDAFYDRAERQQYGYAHVRTTLADSSTLDRYFHNQDFYRRNLAYKEIRKDADGRLFWVEETEYALREVEESSFFPALVHTTTTDYEGQTTSETGGVSRARTFDYDANGNLSSADDYLDDGPADDSFTTITYKIDRATWIMVPEHLVVRDATDRMLRERRGLYSDFGDLIELRQTLTGGRDSETGEEYDGFQMVSLFAYDELGNLEEVAPPDGRTLTFAYDEPTRSHVAGIVDAFDYTTGISYDPRFGLPTETTDENGNVLSSRWDAFGRLVEMRAPDDVSGEPTLSIEYTPNATPPTAVAHHRDATRPGDPLDTAVFIDGLGRTIETKRDTEIETESGSEIGFQVSGQVTFDAMGRVAKLGQPVFSQAPLTSFVGGEPSNPTSYTYDVLDRVRQVSYPQGTQTRVEYGFGTLDGTQRILRSRIDALDQVTRFYQNVVGSVIGVGQVNDLGDEEVDLVTRYTYNPFQSVTSVTDAEGNVTSVAYDTLGRQISVDNPDSGKTELRYDPQGNLGARLTANLAALGEQIGYSYTYGRLDRITYPDMPAVVYTYGAPDAPCNGADRVLEVADESGIEERCYSTLGQVTRTVKTAYTIGGQNPLGPYTTTFLRDSLDRLLAMTYPDGEHLSFGFDAGGRVDRAEGVKGDETTLYVSHLGYDVFGAPVRTVLGNGVEERRTYDPRSRFLEGLSSQGGPAGLFQNLRFDRNPVGSILQVANDVAPPPPDTFGGPTEITLGYDRLNQLVTADGSYSYAPNKTSTYHLELGYDPLGNVTGKNQLHQIRSGGSPPIVQKKTTYDWSYAYDGPRPNAPTRIGDRTFSYDANGNQTGWQEDGTGQHRTVTWDAANRAKSVADQGRTTRFLYGADGQRTNKRGQLGETVYVNQYYSVRNGAIGSKNLFVDGRRVATRTVESPIASKLYYYHGDQLGSTQFVTDAEAGLFQHFEYFPWGELWVEEASVTHRTPYLFNSKELDSQTGLYYFGFRYLEPRESQWLSPDPIFDGMLDTSRLATPDLSVQPFRLPGQMYGYAGNDPVNMTDPLGLAKRNRDQSSSSTGVRRSSRNKRQRSAGRSLGTSRTGQTPSATVRARQRGAGRRLSTYRWYGKGSERAYVPDDVFDASDRAKQSRPELASTTTLKEMSHESMQEFLVNESTRFDDYREVCCRQGRERSALRVFAALWVRHGKSKTDAANLIASEVNETQGPAAATQTEDFLKLSTWWHGLPDRYQPGG